MNVKHLLLKKTLRSQNFFDCHFSEKENLNKCSKFEERKSSKVFGEMFILALLSSAVFCLQDCVADFF